MCIYSYSVSRALLSPSPPQPLCHILFALFLSSPPPAFPSNFSAILLFLFLSFTSLFTFFIGNGANKGPEYTEAFSAELALLSSKGFDFLRCFSWGMIVDYKAKKGSAVTRGIVIGFPLKYSDEFLVSKVKSTALEVTFYDITTVKFVSATPVFEPQVSGLAPVFSSFTRKECEELCELKLTPSANEKASSDSEGAEVEVIKPTSEVAEMTVEAQLTGTASLSSCILPILSISYYFLLEKRVRKATQHFSPPTPSPSRKPAAAKSPSTQPKPSTKSKIASERSQLELSTESLGSLPDLRTNVERAGEKRSATMVADEDRSMLNGGGIHSTINMTNF